MRRHPASEPTLPSTRPASVFVAGGLALALLHTLGLLGGAAAVTFVILGVAAVVATAVGLRRNRPAVAYPWWLISFSLVLFVIGGGAREALGTLGDLTASRSILPDLITLPGYACLVVGFSVVASARRRGQAGGAAALLDAVLAAVSASAVAWAFLVQPALEDSSVPLAVEVILIAYPTMSAFMVAILARFMFSPSTRRVLAYRYLLAGTASLLVGDVIYMLEESGKLSLGQNITDLPYVLAFIACSGMILHPSMAELSRPISAEEAVPKQGRLTLVAAALVAPVLVMMTTRSSSSEGRAVLPTIVVLMAVLAALRVRSALREHARSQARLAHQATHDLLTGLPNAVGARERVDVLLSTTTKRLGLFLIDLDRFKLVNDTFGHTVGDELLTLVAGRLDGLPLGQSLLARVGGDEFLYVVPGVVSEEDAVAIGHEIRDAFVEPFQLDATEVFNAASVGVALSEQPGRDTAENLIRDADTAVYEAKARGRDCVAVFDASMRQRVERRLKVEHDLRHALARDELEVFFQPLVNYTTGRVESLEALLRWNHPTMGMVSPLDFIPVAEDSGQIVEIGRWVIAESLRVVAGLRRTLPGAEHIRMGVNLSSRQLRDPGLVLFVRGALEEVGLGTEVLTLELTESLLAEDPDAAAAMLSSLRMEGIRLSIDDFGTGYSSLSYLKRFPVHTVKVDKSFVDGLEDADSSDESLIAAIVAMSRALGLTTVAEGVESAVQEARLRRLGCEVGQGYLYSRPVPEEALRAVLQSLAAELDGSAVAGAASITAR